MARFRFDPSRLTLPLLVALVGIILSFAVHSNYKSAESLEVAQRVSDAGQELGRVSADVQAVALQQVLAIQGFYESSSAISKGEFRRFVDIIAGPTDNQLAYAHLVTRDELYDFLIQTRLTQPDYALHRPEPIANDTFWPLVHSSDNTGGGYPAGFDFGSDRTIRTAIDTAFLEDRAVAATFIDIPGDDKTADFVLVAPIRRSDNPDGLAVVTLQLDQLLHDRVEHMLGTDARLGLSLAAQPSVGPQPSSASSWAGTVLVAGEPIQLTLEVSGPPASSSGRLLLVLGIATSLLIGGLIYDKSNRRAMARQVMELEKSLAAKDRFLGGVSHELRTPLTVVVGMIEILAGRLHEFSLENRGLIQDVRSSAQELASLVEDHLTSARLSAGALTVEHEAVDLDLVVARALLGTNCPPRLTVIIGKLGTCTGDAIRIRQIVRNLIRNSYRYAVSNVEVRANTADKAGVEILNDGAPVPEHLINTLFEPFVGGNRPGQPEAIGLGLSVSRQLARRMGGDLSYSLVDGQVRFRLSLPPAKRGPPLADHKEIILAT